jgi:hypothetical protein
VRVHVSEIKKVQKVQKVLIDGKDITRCCYYADDYLGIALCVKRNERDSIFLGPDGDADRELLTGKVEIITNKTKVGHVDTGGFIHV